MADMPVIVVAWRGGEQRIRVVFGSEAARVALAAAFDDVAAEYVRAKQKHGDMTLDGARCTDLNRLAALVEEVGETARAMTYDKDHAGDLRKELIQVANVALTWASIL